MKIAEAKARFADLIRRAEADEEIEVTRHGRPVARITALAPATHQPLIGCMQGRFAAPPDSHDGDAGIAALFAADRVFPR